MWPLLSYLHAGDQRWPGGQGGGGQRGQQWVGGVAAGGVGAFPVGLQVIGHVLTCILQLVLVQDDVKHLLGREGRVQTGSKKVVRCSSGISQ